MGVIIIIGIIILIIIIKVSSNNKRQREEAEMLEVVRRYKEEVSRQARLKSEREKTERKRIDDERKRIDELNNEIIIVVYENVDENNTPKAIVKRSNNTYASVERHSERFKISEKILLAKQTINEWNWYDETTYQKELINIRQADLTRKQILEKLKKQNQYLNDYGINYLYHMTHKNNLEKILQTGLKSHNDARNNNLMQNDIANNDVNNRRNKIEPIYNRSLHDYVPLYFNPKNSMLYVQNNRKDIVILAIDRMLIYDTNAIFTDGNAANKPTKFYNDICNLNQLNWDCIKADYWKDFEDGKRKRMAEILLFPDIPSKYIQKIYCNNLDTLQFIQEKTKKYQNIATEINLNLYF